MASIFPVNTAPKMKALGIKFSGTIDPRHGTDLAGRYAAVNGFRKELAPHGLAAAETVGWNLFADIMTNVNEFSPNECSIHYGYHFLGPGRPLFDMNLVDEQTAQTLGDPQSAFYQFLRKYPNVRNLSMHLCYSADKISWPSKRGIKTFPFLSEHSTEFDRPRVLDDSVRNLNLFKERAVSCGFNGPFLIENCAWEGQFAGGIYKSAFNFVVEADFIKEVQQAAGYGMLFDISHAFVHAYCINKFAVDSDPNKARYADPLEYLKDLFDENNIANLHELHAAVPEIQIIGGEEDVYDMHHAFNNPALLGKRERRSVLDMIRHIVQLREQARADGRQIPELVINFEHGAEHWLKDAAIIADTLTRPLR